MKQYKIFIIGLLFNISTYINARVIQPTTHLIIRTTSKNKQTSLNLPSTTFNSPHAPCLKETITSTTQLQKQKINIPYTKFNRKNQKEICKRIKNLKSKQRKPKKNKAKQQKIKLQKNRLQKWKTFKKKKQKEVKLLQTINKHTKIIEKSNKLPNHEKIKLKALLKACENKIFN